MIPDYNPVLSIYLSLLQKGKMKKEKVKQDNESGGGHRKGKT